MQRRNTAYFKIAIFYKLNSIVDIAQQGQLCVQIYWTFKNQATNRFLF